MNIKYNKPLPQQEVSLLEYLRDEELRISDNIGAWTVSAAGVTYNSAGKPIFEYACHSDLRVALMILTESLSTKLCKVQLTEKDWTEIKSYLDTVKV